MRKAEKEIRSSCEVEKITLVSGETFNLKLIKEVMEINRSDRIKKVVFAEIIDTNLKYILELNLLKNDRKIIADSVILDDFVEGERDIKIGDTEIKLRLYKQEEEEVYYISNSYKKYAWATNSLIKTSSI